MRHLTILLLLCALNAGAATYYIDFDGGNDANAGTSTGAAWKRHPWMSGEGVSYANNPGDVFIFKGGVTWSNCFPIYIDYSGTTANWYTLGKEDTNWYSGGSWTRPIFWAPSNQTTFVEVNGTRSNIFIANFEMLNHAHSAAVFMEGAMFITMSNLYIHQWWTGGHTGTENNLGVNCDEFYFGGIRNHVGNWSGPGAYKVILKDSIINNLDGYRGANGTNGYGICVTGVGEHYNNEYGGAFYLQNKGGYIFANCEFHNMGLSQTPLNINHDDLTYFEHNYGRDGTSIPLAEKRLLVYGCYIHDIPNWGSQGFYLNFGTYQLGNVTRSYIFNNVFVNAGSRYSVSSDNLRTSAGNTHEIFYFNNTIHNNHPESASGFFRAVDNDQSGIASAPPYRIWTLNNLLISDVSGGNKPAMSVDNDADGGSIPVDEKYAWHHQFASGIAALSGGYATNNYFAPSSSSATGIGGGTNLYQFCLDHNLPQAAFSDSPIGRIGRSTVSRPTTGNWDIGAFQYGAAAPVITASQTAYGPVGSPFDYQVLSSGGAYAYGASNLPSGLTIATNTGIISGTPSVAGTNTVLLAATNSNGFDQEFMTIGITNPAAAIAVQASAFSYGDLMEGTTLETTIGVTNVGGTGTTLTGSATNPTSPWTIIGDAGYSLANGESDTITLRYSPTTYGTNLGGVSFTGGGGTTVALSGNAYAELMIGTAYPAVQTLVYSPFTTNGNVLQQPNETINAQGGGLAKWGFTLPSAGVISVTGEILAIDEGRDSYFLDIDQNPDASFIWDIIPTNSVYTPVLANARGNGTYDAPQYQPKYWTLDAGEHYLVFYGRERECKLTNITVNYIETTMPSRSVRLRSPKLKLRR